MADKQKSGGLMRVVKITLVVVVVLFVAALAWGFTLPTDYHFERSIVIDADKDDVHEMVGDLRKWDEWGPWRAEDPDMEYTFGESTTEPGDEMSWKSTQGNGSLKFTSVDPESGVEYDFQMEGMEPQPGAIKYHDTDDGKVKVSWTLDSEDTPFLGRYFLTLFAGKMNEMFDTGLANLKTKVEAND